MELTEFAQKCSLQVRRSRQDDTENIVGRFGEIYQYDAAESGRNALPWVALISRY
jgi:hypothetical protein